MRVDATTVTVSSTVGCACSSTTTSCVAPAATCTDAVVGAKPGFSTVMSMVPGGGDDRRRTIRAGPVGCASHDDFCVFDGFF